MKTKPFFLFNLIAFLIVSGTSAFGQYGQYPVQMPATPGYYGGPPAGQPMYGFNPVAYGGGYAPQVVQPITYAPVVADANAANYRITVLGDQGSEVQKPDHLQKPDHTQKPCGDLGCSQKGCDTKGGKGKGKGKGDCEPCHSWRFFGEYLYLRSRDTEVVYGSEVNSTTPPTSVPVQTSPLGVLDFDYRSGFRFGMGIALDECSEISASYTLFETTTSDSIVADTGFAIEPMLAHPATLTAVSQSVEAEAMQELYLDMIELDYRQLLWSTGNSETVALLGLRYGKLEQQLSARYTDDILQPLEEIRVDTDIDFDGIGVKLGLEWERGHACHPVYVYAKGFTSILAGEYRATYQQLVQGASGAGVDTAWEAGRLTPTLDLELGAGWISRCGRWRISTGYMYSAWFNTVKNEDWIRAVQTNNFDNLGDTMTFDGFIGRIEGRF